MIWAHARRHFGFGRPSPPSSQLGASATTAATPTVAAMMHATPANAWAPAAPPHPSPPHRGPLACVSWAPRQPLPRWSVTAGARARSPLEEVVGWDGITRRGYLGFWIQIPGIHGFLFRGIFTRINIRGGFRFQLRVLVLDTQTPYRIRTHHFAI